MITLPNGKICMNEQEAIQWLLDNYPIPFQCSANYAPLTEIGLGTIINPTPAKVKVGSIIFFADSKVSTVVGVTSNGFICSDQYNDLVDDVVYVSNVQLNASGHLIVTLSNGTNIDAGLIKQVSSFSINGSQHLIVSYNDGTSTDLGAIFNGNINIAGNLTADSIIENMGADYGGEKVTDIAWDKIYAGIVKNGNKLTLVLFGKFEYKSTFPTSPTIAHFWIPAAVGAKLYPYELGGWQIIDAKRLTCYNDINAFKEINVVMSKTGNTQINVIFNHINGEGLTPDTVYYFRLEATFLLSNSLY